MLDIEAVAAELAGLFGSGQSALLFTATYPSLDMPAAYRIAEAVHGRCLGNL